MTMNPLETQEMHAMKVAHGLIKQKRYQEARDKLEGIDHPKANQWRVKLDNLLLEEDDPFADLEVKPKPKPKIKRLSTQEQKAVDVEEVIDWDAKWEEDQQRADSGMSRNAQIPRREPQRGNPTMWFGFVAIVSVVFAAATAYLVLVHMPEQNKELVHDGMVVLCIDEGDIAISECGEVADLAITLVEDFGDFGAMVQCFKDHKTNTESGRAAVRECLAPVLDGVNIE